MATTENPAETRVLEGREDVSIGVQRYFTSDGVDPFDAVDWETRTALIPGKDGPSFEQKDVEFPVVLVARPRPTSSPRSTSAGSSTRPSASTRCAR